MAFLSKASAVPTITPPLHIHSKGGAEGGRHAYMYWQMLTHSYVLANTTILSLSFREFLLYRRGNNMCQHPTEQLKGPRTRVTFHIPLPLLVVNAQALGRLLRGCAEFPWDSFVSAFFVGREVSKRAATFQEAKRARSLLGSLSFPAFFGERFWCHWSPPLLPRSKPANLSTSC